MLKSKKTYIINLGDYKMERYKKVKNASIFGIIGNLFLLIIKYNTVFNNKGSATARKENDFGLKFLAIYSVL